MIHIPITTTLSLRSWKQHDVHDLARLASHKEIAFQLKENFPYPFQLSDAINYIDQSQDGDPPNRLAIKNQDNLLGGLNFYLQKDVYQHSGELNYWLSREAQGQGIMSMILPIFCHYIFEHFSIQRIFASVFENNDASMRCLEKVGFKKEGILKKAILKDQQLLDEHRYYLLKTEFLHC